MKKYYFALVLILLISPIMAQNIPSYVPKDGLIGWWPFNGNANDESGKGNNGKVTAASLTLDRKGSANSAYSFNENGSFIEVSSLINTDMCLNSFSFSIWVLRDRLTANQYYSESLISKGKNKLVISYDVGRTGQPDLNYNGFGFDTYGKNYGVYNGILPINKWAHIVCVKTANEFYYYIDNKKYVVPFNIDNQSVSDLKSTLFFGGGNYGGKLDDIAYYNRAITESEIKALYEGNSCPIIASISPQGFVKICEGSSIVLQSINSTYDYQWFKDNQPIAGATSKSYTATKAGEYTLKVSDPICTSVSSVTTIDTILLPTAPALINTFQKICGMESIEKISQRLTNYNSGVTLRWYRNETGTDSINKYMQLDPYPRNYYVSQLSATTPQCESPKRTMVFMDVNMPVFVNAKGNTTFCKGDFVVLEASATNGNQYDYVWKKDYNWIAGTEGKNTFVAKESGRYSYQNRMCGMQMNGNEIEVFVEPSLKVNVGKITGSSVEFVWDTLSLSPTPKDFVISYGINSTSLTQTISIPRATSYTFTGLNKGDTVRVSITPKGTDCTTPSFASAVTREIVIPNNIPTNGLVGYWPFNGNANDESGKGNHGTVNGATLTSDRNGKANSAYSFDGVSNFIDVSEESKIHTSNSFTVSTWFNSNKIEQNSIIGTFSDYSNGWRFNVRDNGELWFELGTWGSAYAPRFKFYKSSKWYNVVCVKKLDSYKLFVDGILVDEVNSNNYDNDFNLKLKFGVSGNVNLEYFNGKIDDIAIYNRALSEQEVKQLYGVSCPKETATSSSFNSLLLSSGTSVSISAEPKGGVFKSTSVEQNQFIPSKAKIGMNKVQYNFKNSQGCNDSTVFTMIVADTVGTHCKIYDTITVIKYDTISLTDTVSILKIKFNLTTGLQVNKIVTMSLYPNPTTDVLHIEVGDAKALEGYRYRIVDALGKEVYNEFVKNTITEIPMKTLGAAGMYQFEVVDQQNKTIQSNKIVLE